MVKAVCEVVDCGEEKNGDVTLHFVPKDESISAVWIYFLEQANKIYPGWKKIKHMKICSKHFVESDFRYGVTGKRFIINGHFPTKYKNTDLSPEIKAKYGLPKDPEESIENHVTLMDTTHSACNEVITSQMNVIKQLKSQIADLELKNKDLMLELSQMKLKTVRNLNSPIRRHENTLNIKNNQIQSLQEEVNQLKNEWSLPPPATEADKLLLELIGRRNAHKSQPYSDTLKTFAFNSMYISPKGYRHMHASFPALLPHPNCSTYWMKDIHAPPGLLKLAVLDIKQTNAAKRTYYSLAFDEMAIRQQLIFDGKKMVGTTDYGNAIPAEEKGLAKSSLFCLATAITGKSFPIAYVLTNGLKSTLMAEFVKSCIRAVHDAGGTVVSITFDGLRSNWNAMEQLGANLHIDDDEFQPFFMHESKKIYIIPDASHMVKLIRNTMDRVKVMFNCDNKKIQWEFVKRLAKIQDEEGLRPATKVTGLHINYHAKKMNTKLCVQTLSCSTATGIDFCRKIGISEFIDSEATAEFLRVCDMIFDVLNTKPFGKGKHAALSKHNEELWSSIVKSGKEYLLSLKIFDKAQLVPLYQTKYGTCVKGLITALTSVKSIMHDMKTGLIELQYLPTYRLSQDPIEVFFGTLRSRLGCNDNPNVLQLSYSVRALLCFKLNACTSGNCLPQEDLLDRVSLDYSQLENDDEDEEEETDYNNGIQEHNMSNLSLFVENIVVYIAGFVAKKLKDKLDCDDCKSALLNTDKEYMELREDYLLLLDKDRGGLCKPTEDLVIVCKIAERVIRREQSKGVSKLNAEKLCVLIRSECLGKNLFSNLHTACFSSALKPAIFSIHSSHKIQLINDISKMYSKTRLHYIAKNYSLRSKPLSKRHQLRKIVHFRNE